MRRILSGLLTAALLFGCIPQVNAATTYRIDAKVDREETATVKKVKPEKVKDGENSEIVFELEPDYLMDEIEIEDREEDEIYYISKDGEEITLSGDTSCELEIDKRKVKLWMDTVESDYRVTLHTKKKDGENDERTDDDDEVRLALSAERGIRMTADTGTKPKLGDTVNIMIEPEEGYQVGTITMTIGDKSVSAEPNENIIQIKDRSYYIESKLDGSRVLTIRNINQSVKIKAEAVRGDSQPPEDTDTGLPRYAILTNGDTGVTVMSSGLNVPLNSDVSIRIMPQPGYEVQSITLGIGTASKTFAPTATQVKIGGRTYALHQNGREVVLYITEISSPISVSASSRQIPPKPLTPLKPATPPKSVPPKPAASKPTAPKPATPKPAASKPTAPKPATPKPAEPKPEKPQQKPAVPVEAKVNGFNPAERKAFLQGNGDGTITPEAAITRAEASAILDRLIQYQDTGKAQPSFQDVKSSDWYAPAVGRLERIGAYEVAQGGSFRPNEKITRAELMQWIMQIDQGSATVPCNYKDVSTDHNYYMAIAYGTQKGWINGYADGTFRPDDSITRSETAHMVLRMMGWQPDEAAITGVGQVFSDMKPGYWAYNQVIAAARGLYRS